MNAAIGGSTNAVLHLLALAGRVGVKLELDDFDRLGHELPLLVDLMPSGKFLMEDFYYAGGVPAVVRALGDLIHQRRADREWQDHGREHCRCALLECGSDSQPGESDPRACRNRRAARQPGAGRRADQAFRGDSAVCSSIAGRAVVFTDIEDFKKRIDDPALEIDENSVMVLQGAGPKGYPGMPEVGNMPMPKKLLQRGITDLVRVSDARMSGTAYGTVVLHVTPESAAGGALALVQNGDEIELDVEARKLELCVSEEELSRRRKAWTPPPPVATGGYQRLYIEHVLQADKGADLDFLVGCRGADVPRESH